VCSPTCLDLTDLEGVLQLDTYCLCGSERLQNLYR
jgi:hypothetical protein